MSSTGIVFDIQRFSIHDGPGIRTTVFLKGCPLHCQWCQNPESWQKKPQLQFYQDKCIHCLKCIRSCQNAVHKIEKQRHVIDFTACEADGKCIAECAYSALKISGKEMEIREVLEEVCADRNFYQNTGGGLTVSGGEPMLQFEFLQELLKEAKKKGIHTCIESSGYAEKEKFEQIVEYVDIFLFDIKHMVDAEHKKYTGVSNRLILENLDYLYQKGVKIILRCPLIPGINDTDEHITGIAELSSKYTGLQCVELLGYHNMGKSKWTQIGKTYTLSKLKSMSESQKADLLKRFQDAGCQKVSIL